MVKSVPSIPVETFRGIARNLLAKTKAGQVNWVRTQAHGQTPETSYRVFLPQSRVTLSYGVPAARLDYVSLQLQNADGLLVESWVVNDPVEDPEHDEIERVDPDGDWRLLSELFREVHRRVTGWDKVLSDVEKALASTGPIGAPPK
ncbi:MAG: hypothetical protein C0501_27340 [Isosphaera sp.]|nr:hypothetical protein [Isosphaera sp.]